MDGKVLVCATSWWNTHQISQYLGETQKPIWINLSSNRTEVYRDITQLYCGHSADLERYDAGVLLGGSSMIARDPPRGLCTSECRGCTLKWSGQGSGA